MTKFAGLVLFSHGSLLCGSGGILQQHAQRIREQGDFIAVEPGYLNYCNPPVEQAIAACTAAGASSIIIVPYFLIAGKFVNEDLPQRLRSAMDQFPDIEFHVARPLEDLHVMEAAVEQLLSGACDVGQWQQNAVSQALAQCELRTDCPLYGTSACQAGRGEAS